MLDGHVLVLQPLCLLLGVVQQPGERPRERRSARSGARPAHARATFKRVLEVCPQPTGVDVGPGQQPGDQALRLLEQRQQQMRGVDLVVPVAQRLGLRVVQCLLGLCVRRFGSM